MENGARPDVLLVSDKQVFVLEFKRKNVILEADIAQADMYGRFLKTCHVESRDKEIITCLVVTELPEDEPEKMNGSVHIVSPGALKQLLEDRMVPSKEMNAKVLKYARQKIIRKLIKGGKKVLIN